MLWGHLRPLLPVSLSHPRRAPSDLVSCGHQHGLCEADPAFALEELDPAEKAKGNKCSLETPSEEWRKFTGGESGVGGSRENEQVMGWLPLSTEAVVKRLAAL